MRFEWDETKNRLNREKHGLSLEMACALWNGPVLVLNSLHPGEPRKLALGKIEGKHWTVIFTLRGDSIRLISARRSREDEKELHDDHQNECQKS